MTTAPIQLYQDPAYEPFLGTNIGEDSTGANITVLSMFARLGLDPWDEASDLAAMPNGPAQKRLGVLIERFKDVPTQVEDRRKVASELLALLPQKVDARKPAAGDKTAFFTLPPIGVPIYWIIGTILLVGVVAKLVQGS